MDDQFPLISVIVPIYKVEPYLRRCVDSILSQTYSNLEVILVDDGSPDLCPQICDEYAELDKRVKVVHKENGGQASARNAALDICKGEFVSFVDSDDFVSDVFVELLYRAAVEGSTDVAMSSFSFFHIDEKKTLTASLDKIDVHVKSLDEVLELCSALSLYEHMLVNCCWNKLYRASLFCDIRFPEGKIYEDTATVFKLLYKCSSISFVDAPLYGYFLRPGSTSCDQSFSERYLDCLDALKYAESWFVYHGEIKFARFATPRMIMIGIYSWWGVKYVLKQPEKANEILSFLRSKSQNAKTTQYFSSIQRLCLLAFLKFPFLYVAYRKITNGLWGKRH